MDIEADILLALRRIMRAVDLHSQQLARTHGLTAPQYLALRELDGVDDGLAVSVLARRLELSQPTVTGIVGRLESRGLVGRHRSEEDRRCVFVQVMPEGRRLLESAPPPLQERFSSALDELADWERTAMLSTLQRIVAMMDAGSLDVAPMLVGGQLEAGNTVES